MNYDKIENTILPNSVDLKSLENSIRDINKKNSIFLEVINY